jgi:hypothetical protein
MVVAFWRTNLFSCLVSWALYIVVQHKEQD